MILILLIVMEAKMIYTGRAVNISKVSNDSIFVNPFGKPFGRSDHRVFIKKVEQCCGRGLLVRRWHCSILETTKSTIYTRCRDRGGWHCGLPVKSSKEMQNMEKENWGFLLHFTEWVTIHHTLWCSCIARDCRLACTTFASGVARSHYVLRWMREKCSESFREWPITTKKSRGKKSVVYVLYVFCCYCYSAASIIDFTLSQNPLSFFLDFWFPPSLCSAILHL